MTDWMPIIVMLLTALLGVLGYNVKLQLDIREHLAKLNGRVSTCDALRKAHEDTDEKRHDHCEERIEKIERKMIGV